MSNKLITLFDGNNYRDTNKLTPSKTDITVCIEGTDIVVFRGSNSVIIPGAGFTARSHFDLVDSDGTRIEDDITPNYDSKLGFTFNQNLSSPVSHKCYLFGAGIDGAENTGNIVRKVDYTKWIDPTTALVPFVYKATNSLDPVNSKDDAGLGKYQGMVVSNTGFTSFYFKTFDSLPVLHQVLSNGNKVDGDIYNLETANSNITADTYVEVKLKITKEECRDWFTDGNPRVNTISLLTAEKCYAADESGSSYSEANGVQYKNIRPLTKLNFPTELLSDTTKGLDITYHIYY